MLNYSALNNPQREAVEHSDGPLVVFAGAGSGKTMVITYRIAHLIRECAVPSGRILAVTFTNKAAREMRERVARLVPYGADELWMGTFHATCARLLRRYADACGVRKDFVIYDELDQRAVIARVVRDLEVDEKMFPPKRLAWRINRAKQEGVGCAEFEAKRMGEAMVVKVYAEYEERLKQASALDFDDLICRLVQALRDNDALRKELEARWDHVLVDEFQDTNAVQFQLVRALCQGHRNVCVVGDDDQSIYRWRGADFRNILNFRRHFPDAKLIKLEQNYRSSKSILRVANALVGRNLDRQKKKLWTDNAEGHSVDLWCCASERDEAARFIALVRDVLASGGKSSDVALLYRTHAQSRVFEEALRAAKMSYRVVGGMRFYDRAEVKDLLAYLRIVLNPDDDVSLLRVINTPPRGIGKTTVDRLLEAAARAGQSVWQTMGQASQDDAHGTAAIKKLADFISFIFYLRAQATAGTSPAELLEIVLKETGYRKLLQDDNTAEADAKLENIRELVGSVREFERTTDHPDLSAFLETVTLQTDQDRMQEQDAIFLMTTHAAKGLEFPAVMVAGLEEGLFPHTRSVRNTSEQEDEQSVAEERRLAYVAFTRAKQRLVLSYAKQRYLFGEDQLCERSRFLDEIPAGELKVVYAPNNGRAGFETRSNESVYEEEIREAFLIKKSERKPVSSGVFAIDEGWKAPPKRVRKPARRGSYVDRSDGEVVCGFMLPGTQVSHPKFGLGQVKEILGGNPPRATVKFPGWPLKTVVTSFLKPAE